MAHGLRTDPEFHPKRKQRQMLIRSPTARVRTSSAVTKPVSTARHSWIKEPPHIPPTRTRYCLVLWIPPHRARSDPRWFGQDPSNSKGGGNNHHSFPHFHIELTYVVPITSSRPMSPWSEFKGGHEDWQTLPSSRTPNPSRGGGPKDVYEMITHPIHSCPHESDPDADDNNLTSRL